MHSLVLFPFINASEEVVVGKHSFWPIRKCLNKYVPESVAQQNVIRFLGVFKESNGTPIQDGIGVVLKDETDFEDLQCALLAYKYLALEEYNRIPYSRLYDDHFWCHGLALASDKQEYFTLFEGNVITVGMTPDSSGRALPGPLRSERIRVPDREDLNRLYAAITSADRVRNALSWYCKAFRWNSDLLDNVVYLNIALEVYMQLESRRQKKKKLGRKARQMVFDKPQVSRWIKQFYDVRNSIAHEGYAAPENLIYRDRSGFPVMTHPAIAKVIFAEAVRNTVLNRFPINDLEEAFSQVLKSERVMGAVISNRWKLQDICELVMRKELTQKQVLHIMNQCGWIREPDYSLTSEQCSEYIQLFRTKIAELGDGSCWPLGNYVVRGLKNVVEYLNQFKIILDANPFVLPSRKTPDTSTKYK